MITAQNLVRFTGLTLIVLGVFFWTGRALTLVPMHQRGGVVFVVSLWALALLAARAGASPGSCWIHLPMGLGRPVRRHAAGSIGPG